MSCMAYELLGTLELYWHVSYVHDLSPHQGYMLDIFGWKPSQGYYTMWVLGIDWLAAIDC